LTHTSDSGPQSPAPHRAFAALRTPGFAIYLLGSAVAMMADSIEHVISYWMIFEKFKSPALGGYAVISHWLPFLLFSLMSGALADRFDPRRIIQVGMGLFMVCSLAWGVLFFTDTLQVWHAVVIFSVHGMAGVLWAPASQILVHDIAGRRKLELFRRDHRHRRRHPGDRQQQEQPKNQRPHAPRRHRSRQDRAALTGTYFLPPSFLSADF